jgi:hypothetical protein
MEHHRAEHPHSARHRALRCAACMERHRALRSAGVALIQAIIAADGSGKMLAHFRSATVPGPAAQSYPALLTAVLSKLHHSKSNYEYTVNGICNPYLQVKVRSHGAHACMLRMRRSMPSFIPLCPPTPVCACMLHDTLPVQVLKCLALLGKGSQEATDAMTDILAKVAAAHATVQAKVGRIARTTSGAVAMEAANTIMAIEPVPRLRSYAVQIMANFLKLQDNNMRCASRSPQSADSMRLVVTGRTTGMHAPQAVRHTVWTLRAAPASASSRRSIEPRCSRA